MKHEKGIEQSKATLFLISFLYKEVFISNLKSFPAQSL